MHEKVGSFFFLFVGINAGASSSSSKLELRRTSFRVIWLSEQRVRLFILVVV